MSDPQSRDDDAWQPPTDLELMPFDPEFREDPHPRLRELRERCPVHRASDSNRVRVANFSGCEAMVRDRKFGVDPRKSLPDDPVRMFSSEGEEPSMLFLDDPEHARLRNLVSRAFTKRSAESWRPGVRGVAKELLDTVDARGDSEFDLIETLAAPLPAIAIARILGVDETKQADFKLWSETSSASFFNPFSSDEQKAEAERASDQLNQCFADEIEKRRREPSEDLIGQLVRAEQEGDRMSESELVTMCFLLLVAGNVTTTDLIGNGTRALLQHPAELAKLQADPGRIQNVVEEMLRFDPPVTVTGRITPDETAIAGVPVHAGESMTALLSAANRDPEANPDPDRFDTSRENIRYLSFGGGAHLCMGAHLARVEAQEAVSALVARYPKLSPAERPEVWKQTPGFRGLAEYWVSV
jgi:cytochrome P450